ncbi:MAG: CBS domain-containing protein [Anaerolineales bacterium]|nr:CBS domain-containing protein [Anaerolineales bacterium]
MKNWPRVREWMTPDPITIDIDTSLVEAHKLMTEQSIRRLPVLEKGDLVGIITLGDVRGAEPSEATSLSVWELNYLLSRLTVGRAMSKPVITVQPDTPVPQAAEIMLDSRIAGLPVVEDDDLVGIITESDIFRMIVTEWREQPEKVLP